MSTRPSDRHRPDRLRLLATVFFGLGSLVFGLALADRGLALLGSFSQILLVCFLAWLLAFVVSPVVRLAQGRLGIGRTSAVVLVYILISGLVGGVIFAAASVGVSEVSDLMARNDEVTRKITAWLSAIQESLRLDPALVDLERLFLSAHASFVPQLAAAVTAQFQAIAGAVIGLLGGMLLVVILSIYMVIDAPNLEDRLYRLVPERYEAEARIFEASVSLAFGGFLRAQLALVLIQLALTLLVGMVAGLPYLFLCAVISSLFMFIPFFGPGFALLPTILVAAAFRPEVAIPVALFLIITQTVLVNWAQPRLMRRSVGIHPILVVLALLVGAQTAGLWGAVFGIPVVAVLDILVNYLLDRRDAPPEADLAPDARGERATDGE